MKRAHLSIRRLAGGALLAVSLLACTVQPSGENAVGETSEAASIASVVQEAQTSPRMIEQISVLTNAGWTVDHPSKARAEAARMPESDPDAPARAVHPSKKTLVVLAASSKDAGLDIVYVPGVPAEESIVLRPRDKASAAALEESLNASADKTTSQSTAPLASAAATACTRSYWGCNYVIRRGFTIACSDFSTNPFGRYSLYVVRTGCTWGQAWYGDVSGNAIICPYPNSAWSVPVCG